MAPDSVIERLVELIYKPEVDSTQEVLVRPPGRQPDSRLVHLSKWYNSLTPHDQDMVANVIRLTSRSTLFSVFAILDGVRAFSFPDEGGASLELWLTSDEGSYLLNSPDGEMLHDIFADKVPPPFGM